MSFSSHLHFSHTHKKIMGNLNNSEKSSETDKKCFSIVFSIIYDKVLHLKSNWRHFWNNFKTLPMLHKRDRWSVQRYKWSPTANDLRKGNDPQFGLQMIPNRKWFPMWTASDPPGKRGMAWSLGPCVLILLFIYLFIYLFVCLFVCLFIYI